MGDTREKFAGYAAAGAKAVERRQFPRSRFDEEVKILWAGPDLTALARDVSDRGLSLYIDRALGPASRFAVGMKLRLLFRTPVAEGGPQTVNVIGEVVRVSEDDKLGRIVVAVAFGPD